MTNSSSFWVSKDSKPHLPRATEADGRDPGVSARLYGRETSDFSHHCEEQKEK